MIDHHAIDLACNAILMRRDKPVRIWLTLEHLARLLDGMQPRHKLRFRGIPVNVAFVPTRSRVVGSSGIVEYV